MRKHIEHFGEINTTLNKLIDECGYSTKSHNNSSYLDFRKLIKEEIIDKGFATCNEDIMKIQPSSIFTLCLSSEKSIFYTEDNFVQLSIAEFEKIVNSKTGTINKSVIAGVYLFIKQYIMSGSDLSDYLPKVSYPSKQQIKKGIGISSITTIENAILSLSEMKLIFVAKDMYIEDSKNENVYIPARNVFALRKEDLDKSICITELQKVYGKSVYFEEDVPGNIGFITKQK
ncbi:MAG TPA: hypothetical protein VJ083_06760 [Sedimentibacter sp.]|nr:hypothetical protein [Sedimentibacter sp.]